MQEYRPMIEKAASRMPSEYRDDAIQAGYLGLVKGLQNKDNVKDNFDGYLFRCIKNEIIKEIGSLHRPFCLNPKIFCSLVKYKHMKKYNLEGIAALSKTSIDELEKLSKTTQRSFVSEE